MAFTLPSAVTSPEGVYTAIILFIASVYLMYHFIIVIIHFLSSCSFFSNRIRPYILSQIIYARFNNHFLGVHSVSRSHVVLGTAYFLGTGICNVISVNTLAKASSRAAHLSLVNLAPMFIAGSYEFGARLLGISLHAYRSVHRIFGYVAFIEAVVHVVIMGCTRKISWSDHSDFYGLLVCLKDLSFLNHF
ncbi:hypothetical protein N7468_000749 [Penicillium chermesinum]|uniref:Uncharacterized protein n=1 Tax=Penicillium chermesinum TaxID=63820 RepID=A0A9W9PKT9_9EURO|nr:uncharacterized protein N7468_004183 [Penicillium chermesinum]XP_058336077.1 uncharacterized protein N7468_000749 [Penicillium chermesinum]KAJ5239564.1 hypothetical protein N7468_004183 [Penicillium chermesinum]KAJ5249298.1 hypothetical protein N7468_000749 [Penicillium chermesinum]